MIYLCAGMYRSGSTWLYNAARLLLEHAGTPDFAAGWITEKDALLKHKTVLIKVHTFDADLAGKADVVLTSHRDLRDVAASLKRKFKVDFSKKPVHETFNDYMRWAKLAAYDLHYENLLNDKLSELKKVAVALRLPVEVLPRLPYEEILAQIDSEKFSERRSTAQRYDNVNLLHDGHITDGRHGSWNETLTPELVAEIEVEFNDWMVKEGYLPATSSRSFSPELAAVRRLVDTREFDAARKILAGMIASKPNDSAVCFLRALVDFGQQRRFEGQVNLEKAFALDPKNVEAGRHLFEFYLDAGMLVPAEHILKTLSEAVPQASELPAMRIALAEGSARDQERQTKFWRKFIPEGALVFDAGAHVGAKAEWFLKLGARLVCVEPQPDCFAALREKFSGNSKVALENVGLADRPGEMQLNICSGGTTISTFAEEWKHGRFSNYTWDKKIPVRMVVLDYLIDKHGLPHFCKIDVEGFELSVLQGLTKPIPFVSFEFAIEMKANARKCVEHLCRLGYEKFNIGLGEKPQLHFPSWVGKDVLIHFLETSQDSWLWGDIYAWHEDEATVLERVSKSRQLIAGELVCPQTHSALTLSGDRLSNEAGWQYRFEKGIPVFLSEQKINSHQASELEHTVGFVCEALVGLKPRHTPDNPFAPHKRCWGWTERWLNEKTVRPETRIINIGGSFADGLPHIASNYKFNIDHLAHEYRKLLPEMEQCNVRHIACAAELLPLRDHYADFIYTRNALDHVCNPLLALQEIHRVLKPDGKLLIGAYHNSPFDNEHESTVIDDEFIAKAIEPLFQVEWRQQEDVPQEQNPAGRKMSFVHLVCSRKPNGQLPFSESEIQTVGDILHHFHAGMYADDRADKKAAEEHYRKLLQLQPVLSTDLWRLLYALIRFCTLTELRQLFALQQAFAVLNPNPFWLRIFKSQPGDHFATKVDAAALDLPGVVGGKTILCWIEQAKAFEASQRPAESAAQPVSSVLLQEANASLRNAIDVLHTRCRQLEEKFQATEKAAEQNASELNKNIHELRAHADRLTAEVERLKSKRLKNRIRRLFRGK